MPKRYRILGKLLTIKEISLQFNLSTSTLNFRARNGLRGEALTVGVSGNGGALAPKHLINGERLTTEEISVLAGVNKDAVVKRIKQGYSGNDLLYPNHMGSNGIVEFSSKRFGSIKEAAKAYGLTPTTVYQRVARGERGEILMRRSRANPQKHLQQQTLKREFINLLNAFAPNKQENLL